MKTRKNAFTLIELITVLAVSAIILGIIVTAVVNAFSVVRAAQSFSDAQDRARLLMADIQREISNATQVRDTNGLGGQVNIVVPSDPDHDYVVNNQVVVKLEHAKVDLLVPAEGEPVTGASGALLNPDRLKDPNGDPNDPNNWMEDPTLHTPRGQVQIPVASGLKLVRYFIGLNRPLAADNLNPNFYNNPYDGLLLRQSGSVENLFVLYRAEVALREFNAGLGIWEVNPLLDLDGDGKLQTSELDDPNFFLANGTVAQARRIQEWQRRSRVVTEFSRYDMIMPIYDKQSRLVSYFREPSNPDAPLSPPIDKPRIQPLINFAPTRVSSEPAAGQLAVRSGDESDNMKKMGPDVYETQFGGWSAPFIRLWPSTYTLPGSTALTPTWDVRQPWQAGQAYLITRSRPLTLGNTALSQYYFAGTNEQVDGTEVFDITEYFNALDADPALPAPPGATDWRYPFTYAVNVANSRSNWLSDDNARINFIPMVPDKKSGKLVASFAITEVGDGNVTLPPGTDNRPLAASGVAVTPDADPSIVGVGPANRWQGAAYNPNSGTSTINQRFNVLWRDWDLLAPMVSKPSSCARFIDLRMVPNRDGSASPLHPTAGFPRASITPGSEVVFGPDQNKGENYGLIVRYTRTTNPDQIGPNQYFINYVNQKEPDWTALGFTVPGTIYDPRFYDATNFVSAVLQPRFRVGYLKFNSDYDSPLADGNIFVSYRFQFTEPNDIVAVDYDSREKMSVTLTIRNYPATFQLNAQNVTITGEATVRNFIK